MKMYLKDIFEGDLSLSLDWRETAGRPKRLWDRRPTRLQSAHLVTLLRSELRDRDVVLREDHCTAAAQAT